MHMLSTLQISRDIDRKVARKQQEFPVFAAQKSMTDLWKMSRSIRCYGNRLVGVHQYRKVSFAWCCEW
jgi:hypothetical protein